jgi:hypothetical protein
MKSPEQIGIWLIKSLFENVSIKKARWWNRLGGKPVCHTASPRFISCLMQRCIIRSKQRRKLTSLNKAVK